MNAITQTQITCETTEEHSHPTSTTVISSSQDNLGTNVPIQGVSGAVYAPMNTDPTPQQTGLDPKAIIDEMMTQFQLKLNLLVTVLQKQANAQTDLEEAVSTALEQADWFTEKLHNSVQDSIDDKDFDYEIGNAVERYMRNGFDANDHYDFDAEVRSRVEDEVESMIDSLVEEAVESRLADIVEEKLKNANITINF